MLHGHCFLKIWLICCYPNIVSLSLTWHIQHQLLDVCRVLPLVIVVFDARAPPYRSLVWVSAKNGKKINFFGK